MKINLLLVDDIKENLYALEVLFEELEIENHNDFEGINIFKALSGEEALRLALKERIDLILLDIRMPGMDGFEVAKFLKLTKKTTDIPIVFLTAEFKSDEFVNKGYKVGALDYFVKPIEKFQFLNKMRLYINLFLAQKIKAKEFDDTLAEYMELIDKHIISSDIDLGGNFIRVSQAFCDISGYGKSELIGNSYKVVKNSESAVEFYSEVLSEAGENGECSAQLINRKKNSELYWTENLVSGKFDKNQKKVGYTCIEHDVTDKKELEKISITDSLTGLYNRRYFDDIVLRAINSFRRNDKLVCFSLIDIDHFKQYNDTYGHQKGDGVLKKIAQVFNACLQRFDDYCFRIGGEEFCIVFSAEDRDKACDFMAHIKESVENLQIQHTGNSVSPFVTISVGLTCKRGEEISSLEELFDETDTLLYKAKETGRNRVVSSWASF